MAETLYEESHRCPFCNEPGKLLNKIPIRRVGVPRGTVVETLECYSERCPQYMPPVLVGTSTTQPAIRNRWQVQVNPDGSIPPKGSGATGPKAFESTPEWKDVAQVARDQLRLAATRDERRGEAYEIKRDLDYRGGY